MFIRIRIFLLLLAHNIDPAPALEEDVQMHVNLPADDGD
jgi:hypothetical protein